MRLFGISLFLFLFNAHPVLGAGDEPQPMPANELYEFLLRARPAYSGARDFFEEVAQNPRLRDTYNTIIQGNSSLRRNAERGNQLLNEYQTWFDAQFPGNTPVSELARDPMQAIIDQFRRRFQTPTNQGNGVRSPEMADIEALRRTNSRFGINVPTISDLILDPANSSAEAGLGPVRRRTRNEEVFSATNHTIPRPHFDQWRAQTLRDIDRAREQNLRGLLAELGNRDYFRVTPQEVSGWGPAHWWNQRRQSQSFSAADLATAQFSFSDTTGQTASHLVDVRESLGAGTLRNVRNMLTYSFAESVPGSLYTDSVHSRQSEGVLRLTLPGAAPGAPGTEVTISLRQLLNQLHRTSDLNTHTAFLGNAHEHTHLRILQGLIREAQLLQARQAIVQTQYEAEPSRYLARLTLRRNNVRTNMAAPLITSTLLNENSATGRRDLMRGLQALGHLWSTGDWLTRDNAGPSGPHYRERGQNTTALGQAVSRLRYNNTDRFARLVGIAQLSLGIGAIVGTELGIIHGLQEYDRYRRERQRQQSEAGTHGNGQAANAGNGQAPAENNQNNQNNQTTTPRSPLQMEDLGEAKVNSRESMSSKAKLYEIVDIHSSVKLKDLPTRFRQPAFTHRERFTERLSDAQLRAQGRFVDFSLVNREVLAARDGYLPVLSTDTYVPSEIRLFGVRDGRKTRLSNGEDYEVLRDPLSSQYLVRLLRPQPEGTTFETVTAFAIPRETPARPDPTWASVTPERLASHVEALRSNGFLALTYELDRLLQTARAQRRDISLRELSSAVAGASQYTYTPPSEGQVFQAGMNYLEAKNHLQDGVLQFQCSVADAFAHSFVAAVMADPDLTIESELSFVRRPEVSHLAPGDRHVSTVFRNRRQPGRLSLDFTPGGAAVPQNVLAFRINTNPNSVPLPPFQPHPPIDWLDPFRERFRWMLPEQERPNQERDAILLQERERLRALIHNLGGNSGVRHNRGTLPNDVPFARLVRLAVRVGALLDGEMTPVEFTHYMNEELRPETPLQATGVAEALRNLGRTLQAQAEELALQRNIRPQEARISRLHADAIGELTALADFFRNTNWGDVLPRITEPTVAGSGPAPRVCVPILGTLGP